MLRPGELVINDSTPTDLYMEPLVGGERKSHGCVPRNWRTHPAGCYASAPLTAIDMPLIPRSEWSARLRDKVATKSLLSDIRLTGNNEQIIPSLDQDGKGFCWAHSSTSAIMMLRAVANLPYVGLSAYAIACIIKSYRDEGGWGAESMDFVTQRGVPSEAFWPMQSMSRSNDKPETWANAALHKVTEGWVDMASAQYDRNLTFDQVGTLLLCNIPVVVDFSWWSHSVCAIDLVEISSGSFGLRILNSWGDGWSDHGMGVLEGNRAIPDGSVAPRVTVAAAA
jgi:hypothetical protein